MELPNLTGTDAAVILTVVVILVALIILIVMIFMGEKKITEIMIENKDGEIFPAMTVVSKTSVNVADQHLKHDLGNVFITSDEEKVRADSKSSIIIQVLPGEPDYNENNGVTVNLKVYNKTSQHICVYGGTVVPKLSDDKSAIVPLNVLASAIEYVAVKPNSVAMTYIVIKGAPPANIGMVTLEMSISTTQKEKKN